MRVCKILGPVVSTIKHDAYIGQKLMAVQPLDEKGQPWGPSYLAVDRVQSGEGDTVLVITEGTGARQMFDKPVLPIRSVIVGFVDELSIWGKNVELDL